MADKQAKLMAALKKRPNDDEVPPPPLTPAEPSSSNQSSTLKLRKSNLFGIVTWEECLEQLSLNGIHDYTTCVETVSKMMGNVLANPSEPKFRKIRMGNPNFAAKVYSCKGAPALFRLAGFKDTLEEGFLVLPDGADLAPLQKALDWQDRASIGPQASTSCPTLSSPPSTNSGGDVGTFTGGGRLWELAMCASAAE